MSTRTFQRNSGGSSGATNVLALAGNNFTGGTVPQPVSFGDGSSYRFFGFHNLVPFQFPNMGNVAATEKYTYTFDVVDGNTILIDKIDTWIDSVQGAPADQVQLSIQTTTAGNPDGGILGSGVFTPINAPSYQSVSFSPIELTAPAGGGDVTFAIVIERTGALDAANYYVIGVENAGGVNTAPYVLNTGVWGVSDLQPAVSIYMTYVSDTAYISGQTYTGGNNRMHSVIVSSGGGVSYPDVIPTVLNTSSGWVTADYALGATASVAISGSVPGLGSYPLSPTNTYICDRSDGHITTGASGTTVGRALLTTTMLIIPA